MGSEQEINGKEPSLAEICRANAAASRGMARKAAMEALLAWSPWIAACALFAIGFAWLYYRNAQLGLGRGVSAAGLWIDILGIYILARGVLSRSEEIERTATCAGLDQREELCRKRAEGWLGFSVAGFGFALQLIASML